MKKSLILATLLTLPAMAGEPTLVFTPPAPAPTPAPAACPFSVELGATYRFATKEIMNYSPSKEVDVYGPEITAVYALTDQHAVTLRFGYNYGSEILHEGDEWGNAYHTTTIIHSFYLMPGYRYTNDINETWSVFAGVSLGVTNESIKARYFEDFGLDGVDVDKGHCSDWAMVGTIELGVQYHMTESAYLYAAYEVYFNVAEPRFPDADGFGGKTQVYHSIRAGLGIDF